MTGIVPARIVASIQSSAFVNIALWVGTGAGGAVLAGWVLWGGPITEAGTRADAVERLWPLVAPWLTALAAKSKFTGDQKREVVRAAVSAPVP